MKNVYDFYDAGDFDELPSQNDIIEDMLAAGMMEALFPSDGIFWKNPDGTLTKIEPEEQS
jgi:hypothetical protein